MGGREYRSLVILRLSDMHIREAGDPNGEGVDQTYLFDQLTHDLAYGRHSLGLPDWIFITGDIVNNGKGPEYVRARTMLLEKIRSALASEASSPGKPSTPYSYSQVKPIPGNHDIDRDIAKKTPDIHAQYRVNAADGMKTLLGSSEVSSLAPADLVSIWEKFRAYEEFSSHFPGCEVNREQPFWCENHESRMGRVRICGLNTAVLCFDRTDFNRDAVGDAAKNLALGPRQIGAIAGEGDWLAALRLVLMHHPPEVLRDGDDLLRFIGNWPHLLLSGHMHRLEREIIGGFRSNGQNTFKANATYLPKREQGHGAYHGFEWLKLSRNGIDWYPREYSDEQRKFVSAIKEKTHGSRDDTRLGYFMHYPPDSFRGPLSDWLQGKSVLSMVPPINMPSSPPAAPARGQAKTMNLISVSATSAGPAESEEFANVTDAALSASQRVIASTPDWNSVDAYGRTMVPRANRYANEGALDVPLASSASHSQQSNTPPLQSMDLQPHVAPQDNNVADQGPIASTPLKKKLKTETLPQSLAMEGATANTDSTPVLAQTNDERSQSNAVSRKDLLVRPNDRRDKLIISVVCGCALLGVTLFLRFRSSSPALVAPEPSHNAKITSAAVQPIASTTTSAEDKPIDAANIRVLPNIEGATALAVDGADDGSLYVATSFRDKSGNETGGGQLLRVPKQGDAPVNSIFDGKAFAVTLSAGLLAWVDRKDNAARVHTSTLDSMAEQNTFTLHFYADGSADEKMVPFGVALSEEGDPVVQMPLSSKQWKGTENRFLVTGPTKSAYIATMIDDTPCGMAVGMGSAFVGTRDTGRGTITHIPLSNVGQKSILVGTQNDALVTPRGMTFYDGKLVVVDQGQNDQPGTLLIYWLTRDSITNKLLAEQTDRITELKSPQCVAADGQGVAWTNSGDGTVQFKSWDKRSKIAVIEVPNTRPETIALDTRHAYWTSADGKVRMVKRPQFATQ